MLEVYQPPWWERQQKEIKNTEVNLTGLKINKQQQSSLELFMPTIIEYTVTRSKIRALAAWNLRKLYVSIRTKVSDTSSTFTGQ